MCVWKVLEGASWRWCYSPQISGGIQVYLPIYVKDIIEASEVEEEIDQIENWDRKNGSSISLQVGREYYRSR